MVLLYSLVAALVKISVVAFYLRLSPQRHFVWTCRITLAFVVLTFLGTFPALVAPCRPFRASWEYSLQFLPTTKCIDLNTLYAVNAVVYSVTDFWIVLLPVPMLLKLQLPMAQKAQAIVVFLCGGL